MIKFCIKKVLVFLLIIIGISFLSFSLSYLSPSDSAQILLEKSGIPVTEEVLQKKREELGLDKPMLVQYGNWLTNFVKGDMGVSYKSKKPVFEELLKALPNTLLLTFISTLVVVLISTPIGVLCAKYKDRIFDNFIRFITYLFNSLPNFFISLVVLYILAVKLHLFNVIGGKDIKDIFMPVLVMVCSMSAYHIRQIRAIVLGELHKDYVIGAKARGVSEKDILLKHVLKNSLVPIVTLIGVSFGSLLAGTVIVENIFTWPGLGKLALDAITNRDYPIIQGYVVWMAMIILIVNLLVEMSYVILDPRVKKEGNK